jgi:hypothetical protein
MISEWCPELVRVGFFEFGPSRSGWMLLIRSKCIIAKQFILKSGLFCVVRAFFVV